MADVGGGVSILGNLASNGDSDVYTVHLRAGEAYDFWLGGDPTEDPDSAYINDPLLTLTGPGPTLTTDDDSAEGTAPGNATLLFIPTITGDYTLTVQEKPAAGTGGDYALTFTDRSLDDDISDHTLVLAGRTATDTELIENDILISDINANRGLSDVDVVGVILVGGLQYEFDMRGQDSGDGQLGDPQLRLLDPDGNQVAIDDNSGGNHEARILYTPVTGGTFFLEASAASSVNGFGTYQLQYFDTADLSFTDVKDTQASLFNVPLNGAVQGHIGTGPSETEDGADWYGIHLVAGLQYRFDLTKITLTDPELTLHDASGTALVTDDNGGGATNARIVFTPGTSGTYYLDVHDHASGSGLFQLSATLQSALPAPVHAIAGGSAASFVGSDEADSMTGGSGGDTLDGALGDDTLHGAGGADALTDAGGNDSMDGGDGNDTIDGGTGTNLLFGGNGDDLFDNVDNGDNVSGGAGIDTVDALTTYTLPSDVENLILDDGLAINGTGNALANNIIGSTVSNVLSGLGGADTLNGGQGADTLIGGAGKDLNTGSGGLDVIDYNAVSESGGTFAVRDAINVYAHGDKIDLSTIDANSNAAGNQAFTFSTSQTLTGAAGQLIAQQVATNSFLVLGDVNGDGAADFSLNVYTSAGFGTFHGFDFVL